MPKKATPNTIQASKGRLEDAICISASRVRLIDRGRSFPLSQDFFRNHLCASAIVGIRVGNEGSDPPKVAHKDGRFAGGSGYNIRERRKRASADFVSRLSDAAWTHVGITLTKGGQRLRIGLFNLGLRVTRPFPCVALPHARISLDLESEGLTDRLGGATCSLQVARANPLPGTRGLRS